MSRRLGARSVTAALCTTAALLGTVALSSCASGNDAMTGLTRTTTNSVSGAKGTVALRNVYVAGPARAGESAQVISAFFNSGTKEDEIIGVASPAAAEGRPPASPVLKPGGSNIYVADGSAPTLIGMHTDLKVGAAIPVTFTFAQAGSVTLLAPVEPPAPGAWVPPQSTPGTASAAPASTPATKTPTSAPTTTQTSTPTRTS